GEAWVRVCASPDCAGDSPAVAVFGAPPPGSFAFAGVGVPGAFASPGEGGGVAPPAGAPGAPMTIGPPGISFATPLTMTGSPGLSPDSITHWFVPLAPTQSP